jgi:hypothetical protein
MIKSLEGRFSLPSFANAISQFFFSAHTLTIWKFRAIPISHRSQNVSIPRGIRIRRDLPA